MGVGSHCCRWLKEETRTGLKKQKRRQQPQCKLERKFEAHSYHHCYSGKAIGIIYSECMSVV